MILISLGLLLISAVLIYFSCEFFVNAIEWVGHKLNLTKNATATILAAFGTALPESVVTFVAVVFGKSSTEQDIGVGAAIGGPLVLATIAYAVVGFALVSMKKTDKRLLAPSTESHLRRDKLWFLAIFIFKIALGLIAFSIKPWLGLLFILAYAAYIKQELNAEDDPEHLECLEPLKIKPHLTNPAFGFILLQATIALIIIFFSSHLFVKQLAMIGPWLGLPPQMVALLLSPIATELPEIMNAVIWVRQGKQILALANISGAMMIQATIPSALGIFFTPWLIDNTLVWGAIITSLSILSLSLLLKNGRLTSHRLSYFGLFYLLFAVGIYFT